MPPIFRHIALFAATIPTLAHASPFQNLDTLDAQVARELAATGEIARPIDRRLKLVACTTLPVVEHAGSGVVAVRCAAPVWRIRILLLADAAPSAARPAPIVMRRGDPVTITVRSSGFTASAQGTALTDARAGERVSARIEGQKGAVAGRAIDGRTIEVF